MQILVIEPDAVLAETYRRSMEAADHNVVVCSGAQTAIMAADQIRPDAVVLELQLVEHSGIEFLYEFRSYPEWQDIPVLLQTYVPAAEFNDTWETLTNQLGVAAYIYKPTAKLQDLLDQVARVTSPVTT